MHHIAADDHRLAVAFIQPFDRLAQTLHFRFVIVKTHLRVRHLCQNHDLEFLSVKFCFNIRFDGRISNFCLQFFPKDAKVMEHKLKNRNFNYDRRP